MTRRLIAVGGLFLALVFVPSHRFAAVASPWPHDPNVVVRNVLAQPAYRTAPQTSAQKPQSNFWDEVWSWLGEQLKKLFGPIARAITGSSRVGTVIGVVLTVAALGAIAFVLIRLGLAFVAPKTRSAPSFGGRPLDERRSSVQWRKTAAAFAAAGQYARAIAALFGASLAELDERALVPFDASRTPGEYRRLVRTARAPAAPPFDDLTAGFVRAAYSGVPSVRTDYEDAMRALARFEPQLATP